MRHHKLFIGGKIRAIRSGHTLTQAAFAERLGISTSYLNQIENNQRHVSASVLLALAETFAVDIASLSEQDSDRLLADISEAIADPLIGANLPTSADIKLVVQSAPTFARAFITMHQALRRAGEQLAELDETIERSGALRMAKLLGFPVLLLGGLFSRGNFGVEVPMEIVMPAAIVLGLLGMGVGSLFTDRRCSEPKCGVALKVDDELCPFCGGVVMGVIKHPNERLGAEEDLTRAGKISADGLVVGREDEPSRE